MTQKNNKVLQIRINEEDLKSFKKKCKDKNISTSEVIRKFIKNTNQNYVLFDYF